jgi:hypothetical protein
MILIFRAELENNKKEYASEGKYEDAENCRIKIEEVKKTLKNKKKNNLEYQHVGEIGNLEQSYTKELEDFNNEYELKFQELEIKSKNSEMNLKEKHAKEMEDLYAFLEQKLPKNVKYSREYLELRSQEQNLVKLQRFKEASFVSKKVEVQEKIDAEKWNKEKTEKIKSQTVKTAQKHLSEKNALKKKIEVEIEALKKEKEFGIQRIVLKYKNKKFDLELQQKQEKYLSENANQLKASIF